MPASIRILLITGSLIAVIYVGRKIRRSQIRLLDAFKWAALAAFLLILSIFPQIIYAIGNLIGIQSPVNLVYLIMIAILMLIIFTQAMRLYKLEVKVEELVQETALISAEQKRHQPDDWQTVSGNHETERMNAGDEMNDGGNADAADGEEK